MKYLDKAFSVPVGGDKFREGWERIFGKKEPPKTEAPLDRLRGILGLQKEEPKK